MPHLKNGLTTVISNQINAFNQANTIHSAYVTGYEQASNEFEPRKHPAPASDYD